MVGITEIKPASHTVFSSKFTIFLPLGFILIFNRLLPNTGKYLHDYRFTSRSDKSFLTEGLRSDVLEITAYAGVYNISNAKQFADSLNQLKILLSKL